MDFAQEEDQRIKGSKYDNCSSYQLKGHFWDPLALPRLKKGVAGLFAPSPRPSNARPAGFPLLSLTQIQTEANAILQALRFPDPPTYFFTGVNIVETQIQRSLR